MPTFAASASARRKPRRWVRRLRRSLLVFAALLLVVAAGLGTYTYVRLSRQVDERLQGGLARTQPRIFARPFVLRRGQAMTVTELVERLNDLGYTQRALAEAPGEFTVGPTAVALVARGGQWDRQRVRASLRTEPGKASTARAGGQLEGLEVVGRGAVESVTVEPPLITAINSDSREKRRRVPLAQIPPHVRQAVLAIEDRRFYEHPGVDVIRTFGAIVTNVKGDRPYLVGGSTLTQQLVKNSFLTREKTFRRKLQEQAMALILERRLGKDQILELYLNEVYLGNRGSFAIHGVAEAARMYFAKDVTNLTLAEAATIAGLIQAPPTYSPFRNPTRCKERRNVVLHSMSQAGYVTPDAATRATEEPLEIVRRGLESEAPYFVDHVVQALTERVAEVAGRDVDVYTTLDMHLQRLAEASVREGLVRVEKQLAGKKGAQDVQAALIAVDPATGEVLAYVGGRGYSRSQFNHVLQARRQPGSVFKPFTYLAAFEQAVSEGRTDLTPATVVDDTPTTFYYEDKEWSPRNYGDEYDGPITLRRALAMSRNIATVKVAEMVGFGTVSRLWRRIGTGMPSRGVPAITLGVFEATPWEIAEAYTLFPNGGETRPLRLVLRINDGSRGLPPPAAGEPRRIAAPAPTYLVTSMMRSVVDEGTGAGARASGFALDAAGKSGTTNDLRDAWFVGFTPELLTVVWVGHDDNQALGLSGSQAALPLWTDFMQRALAGHANVPFPAAPEGVTPVEIDRDTGMAAGPGCPRVITEVFLTGTEPTAVCELHRYF